MPDNTALAPQTPNEYREAAFGLSNARGPMSSYALMTSSQLQEQMNIWFKQAEDLSFIRMIHLIVRLFGTISADGILYQIRMPGLTIDLSYVSKTSSHLATVNGVIVYDTSDAGAITFIPGQKWVPAVISTFNRLTAEGEFRARQTDELGAIETIRSLASEI